MREVQSEGHERAVGQQALLDRVDVKSNLRGKAHSPALKRDIRPAVVRERQLHLAVEKIASGAPRGDVRRLILGLPYGSVDGGDCGTAMSNDTINVIEDEPYEGLYRGAVSTYSQARDHLPDRFDLADILRSTREARGWSLELVSEMTRVRLSRGAGAGRL
jgi:hypothetical protein